jgi:hypothetical protein
MWVIDNAGVKHVFVGDTIALNCHCFFHDGHTLEWQKILERLKSEFNAESTLLYIGHGESPAGMESIDWQIGYNRAFLNAVGRIKDNSETISQESQDKVLAAMKAYLPLDAALFLLMYEFGSTIADHMKLLSKSTFGMGRGKAFYLEQLGLMATGKIDELLDRHYHKDAVMVTFDGMRRGKQQLKKYYTDTLKLMGNISNLTTEYFAETEDTIIFRASITSQGRGKVQALNGLYMKDGKIFRHIALTLLPDMDYKKLGTIWTD